MDATNSVDRCGGSGAFLVVAAGPRAAARLGVGAARPRRRRLPQRQLPRAVQPARVAHVQSATPQRPAAAVVQGPLQGASPFKPDWRLGSLVAVYHTIRRVDISWLTHNIVFSSPYKLSIETVVFDQAKDPIELVGFVLVGFSIKPHHDSVTET